MKGVISKRTQLGEVQSRQGGGLLFDRQEQAILETLARMKRATASRTGFMVVQPAKGDRTPRAFLMDGKRAFPAEHTSVLEDWRSVLASGKTTLIPGNFLTPGKLLVPATASRGLALVAGMQGKVGPYQLGDASVLEKLSRELADELERLDQFSLLESAFDEVICAWAHAIEIRERSSHMHQYAMAANWTAAIAREVGFIEKDIIHLRRGAILHDIGKMAIPEHILCKPDTLSPDEWDLMRRHPLLGFELISKIDLLLPSCDIVLAHHERWDGAGYPRGLSGTNIPLPARIFTVVDVWDALICDLPYRPAWPKEMALAYIHQQAGIQFDPAVVDAFFKVAPHMKSG